MEKRGIRTLNNPARKRKKKKKKQSHLERLHHSSGSLFAFPAPPAHFCDAALQSKVLSREIEGEKHNFF